MKKKLKKLELPKVIFTDFDGCLTDDRVWLNHDGEEFVAANRKDGLAINRLKELGIRVVITSTETNKVVTARATKLGIEALQGLSDKVEAIENYISKNNLTWKDSWYIGNDVNDLGSIEKAAVSFCPIDAAPEIFNVSKVVLSRRGGEGLLAEIASRLERIN